MNGNARARRTGLLLMIFALAAPLGAVARQTAVRSATIARAALLLAAAACGGEPEPDPPPSESQPPVTQVAFDADAGCAAPDGSASAAPPDTADPLALALHLNLPAYRLDLRRGDSLAASYPVAIGTPGHPTPTGTFAIARVEWNPWWTPPNSDWARGRARTPPGPANPLGPVKMAFAPMYLIHGTPDSASIGSAASHGCVRMLSRNAVDLAERLQRFGAPAGAESLGTAGQRGTAPRTVDLDRGVKLVVTYELLEVLGDTVYAYRDIYTERSAELDQRAALRLQEALPLDSLAARRLAGELLDAAARATVARSRASLR